MADSIHIRDLRPGDTLRIALKAGRHLEPVFVAHKQNQLRPMVKRRSTTKRVSGRVAKGFSRTVFLGRLTSNDAQKGVMQLQVEDWSAERKHLNATVYYSDIQVIRKYVTPSKPDVDPVPSRPGAFGLGLLDHRGRMNLIRVRF